MLLFEFQVCGLQRIVALQEMVVRFLDFYDAGTGCGECGIEEILVSPLSFLLL